MFGKVQFWGNSLGRKPVATWEDHNGHDRAGSSGDTAASAEPASLPAAPHATENPESGPTCWLRKQQAEVWRAQRWMGFVRWGRPERIQTSSHFRERQQNWLAEDDDLFEEGQSEHQDSGIAA